MDKIDFVLREEVTYEPEEDEDAGKSLMQIGMEQLSKMNRVEALDGLRMYQTLWDQIKPFLQTFQESGQVVTASDIQSFFDQRRREREEEKGRLA
jgi:E3 ubiquitin-protein ligase UBR7